MGQSRRSKASPNLRLHRQSLNAFRHRLMRGPQLRVSRRALPHLIQIIDHPQTITDHALVTTLEDGQTSNTPVTSSCWAGVMLPMRYAATNSSATP